MSKASSFTASFAFVLCLLVVGCSAETTGADRVVAVDSTVQLLSHATEQVTTPAGLTLKLMVSVDPPLVGSTRVQANSFWLESNLAYVAYNNSGLPLVGAIDVLDLKVPAAPRLVSQLTFPSQKINGLSVSNGALYYTGSASASGAVAGKIALAADGSLGAASAPTKLSSFAGTSIVANGDALYATYGDTGGLAFLNSKLEVNRTVNLTDARGVAVSSDGKTIAVVRGQPGSVALFDSSGNAISSYNLGGASVKESKSTIQMGGRLALASLGDGGFAVLCAQTGKVLASQRAVTLLGMPSTTSVTNAVSAGAGLVFAANGVAGVYVYKLTRGALLNDGSNCTAETLTELGYLDIGDFSANMVYFRDGYLFTADGLGGFRVVTVQNAMADTASEVDFASPGTGLVVLNGTAAGALSLSGNASLTATDGTVYVNSSSSKARTLTGNAKLVAKSSFVVGGDSITGNATVSGALSTGVSALSDPFSWLPAPSTSALSVQSSTELSISGNTVRALHPGVYQNGITLSGNAVVTLDPGVYYLSEGGLDVSGNASVTGTGVTIYSASTRAGINLSGNGTIKLTAPTSGLFASIAVYENRTSTAPISLSGNGEVDIRGTVYAASAPLTLSGNAKLPTLGSLDIADTITVTGNGAVAVKQ